jgi:hypothetical protein
MATPIIITSTDLIGFYSIDISTIAVSDTNAMIVELEEKYLKMLLGETLYADYIANHSLTKWTNLINGCSFTDYLGETRYWTSKDLKNMLLGFIYYELSKAAKDKQTITGFIRANNENSERVSDIKSMEIMQSRFNKSVELYHKAYNLMYCDTNSYYVGWKFIGISIMNVINY